jgi:hypothetical protein
MEAKRMRDIMAVLLMLSVLSPAMAWADCRMEGQQAIMLIQNFKQNALSNQPVNKEQFKAQFESSVYRMKQDGCMSELMGLMTVIQNEQQQYPAPKTAQAK